MQEAEDEVCLISKPVNGVLNISKDVSQARVDKTDEESINPFVHKLPLDSFYDCFKLIFMTIFVLPIRVFFILICLLVAYLFVTMGMIGLSQEDFYSKPLSGWRRACKNQAANWLRFLYFIYGFHYVPVKGLQAHPREAPLLVVAPHSSMFDALPVLIMGAPSIVAKGEVQGLAVFSKCINFTQPVYVWREDTNSRQNTISEIKRRVTSDLDWSQIMIFPEGTCTNRSCLITFKPGAFYPGVPVQPVVLRYPNKTDCVTWTWDGPGAAKILWVTLCQFLNRCEVEFLPVYHPSPEEKEDPRLYARNVRKVMADALNVPVMDYTYDDCRIMHKAKLKNFPCNTGLVEFQKLRYRLKNLNLKNVEGELMDQYAEMAQTNYKISLVDFSNYLGIPLTEPTVIELFNSYDRDCCGSVSFKCFLMTRLEFLGEAVSEENISKAFDCFVKGQEDNTVSANVFAKVLEDSVQFTRKIADKLFQEFDSDGKSFLTLEDFKSAAKRKPDYAQLFYLYRKSIEDGSRSSQVKRTALLSRDKKKVE